jgi:nucleoside-diphosphate kinase
MSNITLSIIKPEIIDKGLAGELFDKIIKAGFRISALKSYHLNIDEAKKFYEVHKSEYFFERLINYMSSGPIIIALLEKENAVAEFRDLIGNTDPSIAEENTIRKIYGTNITINAVHGSDSDENADKESNFFFSRLERL